MRTKLMTGWNHPDSLHQAMMLQDQVPVGNVVFGRSKDLN